jgi:hypothetical protein
LPELLKILQSVESKRFAIEERLQYRIAIAYVGVLLPLKLRILFWNLKDRK